MRQRDVWLADPGPATGSEQAGRRPVVIISGDTLNSSLPIVIAVPLTTKLKGYPACIRIAPTAGNGLIKDTEAVAFQVRAISKKRLHKQLGSITEHQLTEVIKALVLVLMP